jgi:hypothetical protein
MGNLAIYISIAVVLLIGLQFLVHTPIEETIDSESLQASIHLEILNTSLTHINQELASIVKIHRQIDSHKAVNTKRKENELKEVVKTVNDAHAKFETSTSSIKQQLIQGKLSTSSQVSPTTTNVNKVESSATASQSQSHITIAKKKKKRAVLFTMDSISAYEIQSLQGGAAGEILIRRSLEQAFQELNANVELKVIKSDLEFDKVDGKAYDIIIVDPWTWAAKGWVPKPALRGQDNKIFILDFFGNPKSVRNNAMKVPASRVLTAFGSPWNTFLGYYIKESSLLSSSSSSSLLNPTINTKLKQGVIWGKDPKHFDGKINMLQSLANHMPIDSNLISVSTRAIFNNNKMKWLGHQNRKEWLQLLHKSKFLLGLGNPLLGPSAIDAIASGCMYINPIYKKPIKINYYNQHPYAMTHIGAPYVCSYPEGDLKALLLCVDKALSVELKGFIPEDFTHEAYIKRVKAIFDL